MLIKLALQNVLQKKLRASLITLTLALIVAVIYVSLGAGQTAEKIVSALQAKRVGDADIAIAIGDDSPYPSFAAPYDPGYEYSLGFVDTKGQFGGRSVAIRGTTVSDLEIAWGLGLSDSIDDAFQGSSALVSESFAKDNGLSAGSVITVVSSGVAENLVIVAVIADRGFFLNDGNDVVAVPRSFLQARLGFGQRVNYALVKLREGASVSKSLSELASKYYRYKVDYALDKEYLETAVNAQTSPYTIISVVVTLLGAVIIGSIFKVIAKERVTHFACLRSLGAEKSVVSKMLLCEGVIYSTFGSALGYIIGVAGLSAVASLSVPESLKNLRIAVIVGPAQLTLPLCVCAVVAIGGALLPASPIAKRPIKNLLFGIEDERMASGIAAPIIGSVLVSAAVFTPRRLYGSYGIIVEPLLVGCMIAGSLLVVPFLSKKLGTLIGAAFAHSRGGVGFLVIDNLKSHGYIASNIRLLMVGLSCFLLAFSVVGSVSASTEDLYRDNARFDLFAWYDSSHSQANIESQCYNLEGFAGAHTSKFSYSHPVEGSRFEFEKIQSVDPTNYLDYWLMKPSGGRSPQSVVSALAAGRNILITSVMAERLGVEVGSRIGVWMSDRYVDYTVTALLDSLNSSGNSAFISEESFRLDIPEDYFMDTAVFVTGDPSAASQLLRDMINDSAVTVRTMDELEADNYESYRGVYLMLRALTFIVLALCAVGVANHQVIVFIERKKSFSVQRSLGMSRSQLALLLLAEAGLSGVLGGVFGAGLGSLLILIIPHFIKATGSVINVSWSPMLTAVCVAAGATLSVAVSGTFAARGFKLSIIESIRYE